MSYRYFTTIALYASIAIARCSGDAPPFAATDASGTRDAHSTQGAQTRIVEEQLWYDVKPEFADLQSWKAKWEREVEEVKMIGGCDCHVAQYRVRATRAAIDDFPIYDVQFTGD